MINVADIVADSELMAPKPFVIIRSTGQWTQNGFAADTVTQISQVGPVQRAGDKEIQMIPEADRVGAIMAFWCLVQVFVTRGKSAFTAAQSVTPEGVYPGTIYTIDPAPPVGTQGNLYKNGIFQTPGFDYTYANGVITMLYPTMTTDRLAYTWTNSKAGTGFSDVIEYDTEQYRILGVRHYPGSGYWKALGTRLSTI